MTAARTTLRGQPLLLSLLLAGALAPGGALAQDVIPGGVVEMLPAGVIVGDGATEVTLHLVALGADGGAVADGRFKLTADKGKVSDVNDAGNGLLTAVWVPPAVTEAATVELSLKGSAQSGRWAVQVVPPVAATVSAAANPSSIVLGQQKTATLSLKLDGSSSGALTARASSGAVANVTNLGGGTFSALYTPPDVNYPHLSLITFSDPRAPGALYGYTAMPLSGNVPYPVRATANASVILVVGDREFGPFPTDASGSAKVPIEVPPGVTTATLKTVVNGKTTESTLDLKVPESRRISMIPGPAAAPADGATAVPLRAVVVDAKGGADAGARVHFTASSGTVTEATHEGNGVYTASWTPAYANSASTARVSVSIEGEPGMQSDAMEIPLTPALPQNLSLSVEGGEIPEGATGVVVKARVTAYDGKGLAGRSLAFDAEGATIKGDVKDSGGGDYQATFALSGGDVSLTGAVRAPATANPVAGLVVLASEQRVAPDSGETSLITVVSVDDSGYPVANVPVKLSLGTGDGALPSSVTTDANGLAQVRFTAGAEPGVVTVLASSGLASGGAAVLQLPDGVADDLLLPTGGSGWTRSNALAWGGIVNTLSFERGGPAVAAAPAVSTSGALVSLAASSATAEVAPGGTVEVTVRALDGAGRGINGKRFEVDVIPSGEATTVVDKGDGSYTTRVTAPTDATEIKVVFSTPDGTLSKVLKIPVSGASPWDMGGATEPAAVAAAEPVAVDPEPAPVSKEPRPVPDTDFPWMRAKVSGVLGFYNYDQTPLLDDGPLWNQAVSFEYPAYTGGFDVDASAWLDALRVPYVGVEAQARLIRYSTTWPNSADTVIGDWVPHITALAKARYPFASGGSRFHVGAKVGFLYGDFITYRKGDTDTQLVYEPLPLPGFALGAEVGADLAPGVFLNASLLEGLRGPAIYSTNVDVEVGYDLPYNLYVSGGYQLSRRDIEVVAAPSYTEVGNLADTSNLFLVGFGYRL